MIGNRLPTVHLLVRAASVWVPLAAALTAANVADNEEAVALLDGLRTAIRSVLGDPAYDDTEFRDAGDAADITRITSRRGAFPPGDGSVGVRRVFHALRCHAIANWNGQCTAIRDGRQPVPTRGRLASRRWVLGAILVYQRAVWRRCEADAHLRMGRKPFLKAA